MVTFRYRCTNGHELRAPEPLARCVGYIGGRECEGELKQLGRPRTAPCPACGHVGGHARECPTQRPGRAVAS